MNAKKVFVLALLALTCTISVMDSISFADPAQDSKSKPSEQLQLPPGWTANDMQACMLAGAPNEKHARLTRDAGVWQGKSTMWMAPGAEPIRSEVTNTITPIMGGCFIQCDWAGEIPGMGPLNGLGLYGYDNVSQEFVAASICSCGTSIMNGQGELSSDGKTLTWSFTTNCPLTKKQTTMRDVETTTGPNTKTLETFTIDPKTGKEYRMMSVELTRKESSARN